MHLELINEIFDFSRIESEKHDDYLENTD